MSQGYRLRRSYGFRAYRPGFSGFGFFVGEEIAGFFLLVGPWAFGVQVSYRLFDEHGRPAPVRRASDRDGVRL